ncbi:monovalent cation:proton antiporter-2 (CPA2) family protein [Ahrensia sp. 13_GOM-1096m]|uniref:monovalent cation:proton antiporter-2 (CPA2) family protein n=1 Tax=Ahrensia sp. 13_GOM-1096m TaxID=1380380 RepID=UPI00047DA71F|nr:monovalent cation:proton antiporter-2 (CPA2) family protein [Ahrensia sp. 13_GOM-1096m]
MAGGEATALFSEAVLILGAAVVAAPLFKKLGLGTVLGYLAAGVVIGPVLRLVTDAEQVLQVSELGVVFLLFIIGLELKPSRLWSLRRDIFGIGLLQVFLTGVALTSLAVFLTDKGIAASAVIGFGLALSSTAFALQVLEERGEMNRQHGQKSFAILLFQDLAIVPLLAVIPLLAPFATETDSNGLIEFGKAVGAIVLLIVAGRYLLTPLLRIIGNTGAREAMLATALLVVLGSAYLMQLAGLSMAMGAFIAGVMLAESSYRHELEADIEPFRGLLLGLFFIAIGMSLNLGVLISEWLTIIIAVPLLMIVKSLVVFVLCRIFGSDYNVSLRTAMVLPQGGEFGFVLFSAAAGMSIFDQDTSSLLIAITTLSMALTPLSVALGSRLEKADPSVDMEEDFEGADESVDVLMIGFSRFGQIASQALLAGGKEVTIIDNSADRVQSAGKFGFRIYFGDGTRKEVLEAAGIRRARLVAICTHNMQVTDRIVDLIKAEYPEQKLYVRSYDRTHSLSLRAKEVEYELRETFESGLLFGASTLEALGVSEEQSRDIVDDVRRLDEQRLRIQASEGLAAGGNMIHTTPVKPEPLTKPKQEGRIVNVEERHSKKGANA